MMKGDEGLIMTLHHPKCFIFRNLYHTDEGWKTFFISSARHFCFAVSMGSRYPGMPAYLLHTPSFPEV